MDSKFSSAVLPPFQTQPGQRLFPNLLGHRLVLLGLLLVTELLVVSVWLDSAALRRRAGLAGLVYRFGPWVLRSAVAAAGFFFAFSFFGAQSRLRPLLRRSEVRPVSATLLAGHVLTASGFVLLSLVLFGSQSSAKSLDLLTAGWVVSGVLSAVLAALAFVAPPTWASLLGEFSSAWLYAGLFGAATSFLGSLWWRLWEPASRLTFVVVQVLLGLVVPQVVADPATRTVGTSRFDVLIEAGCSGLEGVGLVLIFSAAWLVLFRSEIRFPRGLLILPLGAVLIWLLNAGRITALILIGHFGAPGIAAGGFHSQAGWLIFNGVAIGLVIGVRSISWFKPASVVAGELESTGENPAAPYLVPFLAILTAAMVSRAFTGSFEWLYPIRLLTAAAALWFFRSTYRRFDWHFGWLSPVIGAAVFVLWLALDLWQPVKGDNAIGSGLQAAPLWLSASWLVCRTLAHTVTVPIAEELAFRGYLIRRLISADFESLDWRRYTHLSLIISSVAFSVMHGDRWIAGAAAGALYALALLWRGRIGDAVVAHATTNVLLAGWVLWTRSWGLW